MKAGVYYWDGWSGEEPKGLTERLKAEFCDRKPKWGWMSNTLELMDQQIELASSNGIGFFAFDWYYPEGEDKNTVMHNGLDFFIKSQHNHKMEFCLMVANHLGFRIYKKDWDDVIEKLIPYLKNERYLKVDGKPLLIIFRPYELTVGLEGSKEVEKGFEKLRQRALEEGLVGVTIAGCCEDEPEMQQTFEELFKHSVEEGYDFITGYNYTKNYMAKGIGTMIHSYREFMKDHNNIIWARFVNESPLPYIPLVTSGFDKRPWEDIDNPETWSWYYPDRTPEQVAELVRDAKQWIKDNPQRTSKEQILLIYAWNEFGEGGYIAPTEGDNGRYLEVIGRELYY